MHIPDGFIDAPVSIVAGAVAVAAVAVSLRGARNEVTEASAPMAGLTAVFVFAAQMVNFPVAAGTSGHLIGAALAAILIGPYAAVLAMTVVLTVQALVFADGGLSALGLNVVNLGVLAVVAGWFTFRGAMWLVDRWSDGARRSVSRVGLAAGVAGFVSVLAAASGFIVEFVAGGNVPLTAQTVAAAMLGVHALIGVGEAVITAMVVSAVVAVRPDLVYGLRVRRRVVAAAGQSDARIAV
ncbi:MAG: cobalt/nickel transport system permease protein [Actinomycetota bacterium]|nr:cobalt/nickel transport system permease protein [Actinomycetota bacterium]